MKIIKQILIILALLFINDVEAGEPHFWLTYGYSKYIQSPGVEACYLFRPHIGIHAGLSCYIQYPDENRVTNIFHTGTTGIYNANIDYAGYIFRSQKHTVGFMAGFKIYFGPDYRKLIYDEEGEYYIYYDASSRLPDYGLDLGLFYRFKRVSILGKLDFARNRFRIGIGYSF